MSSLADIGEWYRARGGELLEVVAIDEDDGTIEVQYFDGTVEELDLADWQAQRTARAKSKTPMRRRIGRPGRRRRR